MAAVVNPAIAIVNRAMDHHRQGHVAAAEAGYREALVHEPDNPDALHLLGSIIGQRGDAARAVPMIQRALKLRPSSVEAHINLANLLLSTYQFAEAENHFRTAEALRPGSSDVANGIGACALRRGNYEDAEAWLKLAVERDARCVSALVNLGSLMEAVGRPGSTFAYYDRALAVQSDSAEAHQYRSLALLARERLIEGWREYEWRFKRTPVFKGRFAIPYWRGETLVGQKILVWTEQGLGDEILTLSMLPDLSERGAHIVLVCSPRLAGLAARSFTRIDVIPFGGKPAHDGIMRDISYQASMSDLGALLRSSSNDFPSRRSFLRPEESLTRILREKYLGGTPHKLIGISWRSSAKDAGPEKTIPLQQWEPVLSVRGIRFVSLQYGDVGEELRQISSTFNADIVQDAQVTPQGDMGPFAAQVAAMDHVISVSNTTAHIAGAVGARTSVLVPSNSGRLWYWFLERTDSPWYPSVRLYRQAHDGWDATMRNLAAALASEER